MKITILIVLSNTLTVVRGKDDSNDGHSSNISSQGAGTNDRSLRCPMECVCLSHSQALCRSGGSADLDSLVLRVPWSVEHLSVSKSHIHHIKSHSFTELKRLRTLSLDGNNITRIQQFAFKGLSKLQELSIQNTSLSKLEKFVFSGLQNVTAIMLSNNKIGSIEEYAFAGTSHVRLILLTHNPLHVIESNAFSGLRNVEHLILPAGIRSLEPDSFRGLDSVGLLKLAFMDLVELLPLTFRGLNHVHVLLVQQSDLGTIRPAAFRGLTNVGTLNLFNNKIDYMQELAIELENRVKIVRLVGNHILRVPATVDAVRVRALDNFTVVGNHFPCDCTSPRLLFESALANRTSYNFSLKNYCISPLQLNGKSINEMRRLRLEMAPCADSASGSTYFGFGSSFEYDSTWHSDSWNLATSPSILHHFASTAHLSYYACFFSFHRAWTNAALRF